MHAYYATLIVKHLIFLFVFFNFFSFVFEEEIWKAFFYFKSSLQAIIYAGDSYCTIKTNISKNDELRILQLQVIFYYRAKKHWSVNCQTMLHLFSGFTFAFCVYGCTLEAFMHLPNLLLFYFLHWLQVILNSYSLCFYNKISIRCGDYVGMYVVEYLRQEIPGSFEKRNVTHLKYLSTCVACLKQGHWLASEHTMLTKLRLPAAKKSIPHVPVMTGILQPFLLSRTFLCNVCCLKNSKKLGPGFNFQPRELNNLTQIVQQYLLWFKIYLKLRQKHITTLSD